MQKKRKPEVTALIIETVCLSIIFISNIAEFFLNPDRTGLVSVLCFAAALLCLVIAWVQYFRKKHKKNNAK